jgi:hypothetical protein
MAKRLAKLSDRYGLVIALISEVASLVLLAHSKLKIIS